MSKAEKLKKKLEREQAAAKARAESDAQVVKMKFKEDKFYNDPTKAEYEKDKVYEIRGGDKILRWLKRGGEIVSGNFKFPEGFPNPSEVVENKYSEQKPYEGKKEEPKKPEPKKEEVKKPEPKVEAPVAEEKEEIESEKESD